jgi:uncharacterized membrane protein
MDDAKETARLEAFSDGVIAIVITLLAFEIRVPQLEGEQRLLEALLERWPVYLAFLISFLSLLVMWINHHDIFKLVRRVDRTFMILNGLLLLCITLVPFSTLLLSDYIRTDEGLLVAVLYNGLYMVTALAFNLLWRYASGAGQLLKPDVQTQAEAISQQYRFGPLLYLACIAVAVVSVPVSLLVNLGMAVFFLLPPRHSA